MKQVLLSILLSLPAIVSSQDYKRTQNWYFGDSAGISFATNPPAPLAGGAMSTVEGCATISDTNGNLLFYTNGVKVWNKSHQIMPNGSGLFGHESSTQAALIVPQPDNDSFFYVFTTYAVGSGTNGFRYSIVNMNKNNGLGDVTVKNILLQNPVCEKLAATKHANGKDIWVVAHGFGNDLFYAYLVTECGIVNCPIVSKIGSFHQGFSGNSAQGDMKFSSTGKELAVCVYTEDRVEVFDFNPSLGKIETVKYVISIQRPYSVEFSSNRKCLYVTTRRNYLFQFDISVPNEILINNSGISLYNPPNTVHSYYRGLQIASNSKIYLALADSNFMGIINFPDTSGSDCLFNERAIDLSPNRSAYGLANFVASYFYKPSTDFSYDLDCKSNQITLKATDTFGATAYYWKISKTSVQTFSGRYITYTLPDTGNYTIDLLAVTAMDTAMQSKQIFIPPTYSLNLGNDTILCFEQNLLLDAGPGQHCYQWNDSSSGNSFNVDTSGTFHVKVVSNGFCTYHDSIKVDFVQPGNLTIGIIRSNDTLIATGNFYSYQWYRNNVLIQNSSVNYCYLDKQKGTYKVIGTDSFKCFPVTSNDFIVDTLTRINEITRKNFISYPNPVSGELFHIYSESTVIENVKIYTIEGKVVFEDNLSENTKLYDLNHLKKGIYILNINQLYNHKIILK